MILKEINRQLSRLRRSITAILRHPLTQKDQLGALKRYFSFHVFGRLLPGPILFPYVGGTGFLAQPGMAGVVGNIYMGLEDFEEMAFLLHFLRPNDLFVDVGANVGAYTLLASGVCGANSVSIEPIPSTFNLLMRHVRLNDLAQRVQGHNLGIGSRRDKLSFTNRLDVLNRVVLADDPELKQGNITQVDVLPLDEMLNGRVPVLLKVDVEGYEQEVIQGALGTLQSSTLQAIIIELSGHENRYGFSYENVHARLVEAGFSPYTYFPFERRLQALDEFNRHKFNTIYLRDLNWVHQRVVQAAQVTVLGTSF